MTYFQYHIDLHPCGDSYSKIILTDASETIVEEIIESIKQDNKLFVGRQQEAITDILKIRGYSVEIINQKIFTLENPK